MTWLASPFSDGISGRLLSAVWDAWADLPAHRAELDGSDVYTLRRVVPGRPGVFVVKRIGIVGCGLIGRKRALSLGDHQLVAVTDVNGERAQALASQFPGCVALSDAQALAEHADVDIVVVATTNDSLTPSALAAVERGKHVLIEKPAARTAAELEPLLVAVARRGVVAKVGFNHRFHPGARKGSPAFQRGRDWIAAVYSRPLRPRRAARLRARVARRPRYRRRRRACLTRACT